MKEDRRTEFPGGFIEVRWDSEDKLDEIYAEGCTFRLERMSEDCVWLAVYPPTGVEIEDFERECFTIYRKRGKAGVLIGGESS